MKNFIILAITCLFWAQSLCAVELRPSEPFNSLFAVSLKNDIRNTFSHVPNASHITQNTSSAFCQKAAPYTGYAVSAALITYGIVAQNAPALQNLNAKIDNFAREKFPRRFHLDDWIQYAPVTAYLTLDIIGVPARHPFLQRTAVAASSYIIMAAIVNVMKWSIPVLRPDGSAYNSFPSGHTATAFTGAHLLGKEYGRLYPAAAAAGYLTATTTGLCRMANKRHWLSDVAAGAGIGILSVEVAYLMMPLFDRWFERYQKPAAHNNNFELSITPTLNPNCYGASLVCVF